MIALLLRLFGAFIGSSVAKFVAMKAILVFLTLVVLPIILFNFKIEIAEYAFTFISDFISVDLAQVAFTGIGGWLVDTMNVIPVLSLILVAYVDRLIIKLLVVVF